MTTVRTTDRLNGTASDEPGTVEDTPLTAPVQCTATAAARGATCALNTTLDALVPGAVTEGGRAIQQLGRVELWDGGPDADVDTADNDLFATQGVFVP